VRPLSIRPQRRPGIPACCAAFAILSAAQAAPAQLGVPICGSPLLPRATGPALPPGQARASQAAVPHVVGERETLWIYDYSAKKHEQASFTYRAVNDHSYVLVDDALWSTTDTRLVSATDVARLGEVFERNAGPAPGLGRGIYEIETGAYAPVSPVGGDSMVYIALTEIKSSLDLGYIVGYVSSIDRTKQQYSNYRNLVILDALPRTSHLGRERTLAHEFQHVIHGGIDDGETRWIDEGIAVYSQQLCGYEGNSGAYFFSDPNIGLFDAGATPTIADYDKAYLIMLYMADRYGLGLLGEIVRSTKHSFAGIDAALGNVGSKDTFVGDVFPAWAAANVSVPDASSRYAYRTYDPRAHWPPSFGEAGALPIRDQGSLISFGLRYIHAGSGPVAGEVSCSSSSPWSITSVEGNGGSTVVRQWHALDARSYRDCSFGQPWLVLSPVSTAGGAYSYSVDWHAPTDGPNPVVIEQTPTGTSVSPYGTTIRGVFANLEPAQDIAVSVSSRRLGPLDRDIRLLREGTLGRCGETVVVVDSASTPLPADDVISVHVPELVSGFGGVLGEAIASWQFGTGAADTEAPLVTIGLLANPAIPSHVTAVVYSNEPLYPDGQGPVRLAAEGGTTVLLQAQDAAKRQWTGSVELAVPGLYDFVLRAADLAGNDPAQPWASYVLLPTGGEGTGQARPALRAAAAAGWAVETRSAAVQDPGRSSWSRNAWPPLISTDPLPRYRGADLLTYAVNGRALASGPYFARLASGARSRSPGQRAIRTTVSR